MSDRKRSALAEVQFIDEDLPPAPPRRTVYKIQEASLREQPGRWALIGSYPNRGAANGCLYQRRRQWGEEFEVTVRDNDVFARYVNGNGEERPARVKRIVKKKKKG